MLCITKLVSIVRLGDPVPGFGHVQEHDLMRGILGFTREYPAFRSLAQAFFSVETLRLRLVGHELEPPVPDRCRAGRLPSIKNRPPDLITSAHKAQ